jgi:hypothetical protein
MILNGILNFVLLFTVLVAVKKKPYLAALLFAAIKSALNFILLRSTGAGAQLSLPAQLGVSLAVGLVYAGLASAFVWFFVRLGTPAKGADEEVPAYKVGGAETVSFRWEIIPLIGLLLLLLLL